MSRHTGNSGALMNGAAALQQIAMFPVVVIAEG
jgi:hypothetical protein